jgi:hypothetical protein
VVIQLEPANAPLAVCLHPDSTSPRELAEGSLRLAYYALLRGLAREAAKQTVFAAERREDGSVVISARRM